MVKSGEKNLRPLPMVKIKGGIRQQFFFHHFFAQDFPQIFHHLFLGDLSLTEQQQQQTSRPR